MYSDLDKLLEVHNSDVRSMINFIQLNKSELSQNDCILSNDKWKELHELIKTNKDNINILTYIHDLSIKYNCVPTYVKTVFYFYLYFITQSKAS